MMLKIYSDNHASIDVGSGAIMSIPFGDFNWQMRYCEGEAKELHLIAASVLDSYAYLLSDAITTKEAIRRLRFMRNCLNKGTNK